MHKLYKLKKVKKILLATNNPGKFKELKEILPKKIFFRGVPPSFDVYFYKNDIYFDIKSIFKL